jgi:hypothetical protein
VYLGKYLAKRKIFRTNIIENNETFHAQYLFFLSLTVFDIINNFHRDYFSVCQIVILQSGRQHADKFNLAPKWKEEIKVEEERMKEKEGRRTTEIINE